MENQNKINKFFELKVVGIIIFICFVFYIVLFLTIHFTSSPEKRPSFLFWDDRRQGYTPDPLNDRYWELRKKDINKDN